jgi:hypothetical protein
MLSTAQTRAQLKIHSGPLLQLVEPSKIIITRVYPIDCYRVKKGLALLAKNTKSNALN